MASLTNGHANGVHHIFSRGLSNVRFSDIPSALDIPVSGADADEAVEVNLEELLDDPTELCTLLENENAAKNFWMVISLAYAKQKKMDHAIEILKKGLESLSRGSIKETLAPLSLLCWLYLYKSREAPRVVSDGELVSEAKTKDYYLQQANGVLNDASRVNPAFPPLFLARGILSILRASLKPPSKVSAPGAVEQSERVEILREALKCFEDASRVSGGRNMMALLGKARTLFSLGKYAEALEAYQEVLGKMPDLLEPDPRIGIGCCFWQLSHFAEAREAWERAHELNPDSKIANILLGLYHIHDSSRFSTTDPGFLPIYKKAITEYIQIAFKLDRSYPLTCVTFGNYFLPKGSWPTVESLARKAIERTDVNAIASDGWYLLARKEHSMDPPNPNKAVEFYNKADAARGGGDRGFLPAKFGAAQILVMSGDIDGAKFRLEKIIQFTKSLEAQVLLGNLYAAEVFANQSAAVKEDKSRESSKAIQYLETVRAAWKDPTKHINPDTSILICLSRLYEAESPEKSLACLKQVYDMSVDKLPESQKFEDIEDAETRKARQREFLPPQLLNNIGCFEYQLEKFENAQELFQAALTSAVKTGERDETIDTDAFITTTSFNLARTYESLGHLEDAKTVYEGLLKRHPDYTDAKTRLAFIELRQNPTVDGPKAMTDLYETDGTDLEVRALFAWYLNKSKRRAINLAEDVEQRLYKHTLQKHDKHDLYALTGMGNLNLVTAREMRRDTEAEKEKRRATYQRAVEFYQKALLLDPKNAYAAQGIAIVIADEKRDFPHAAAIFAEVKNTIRDASIYLNLGHVYAELKQYTRAIEHYEIALSKEGRASDPQILACLGRVWLLKGKHDKTTQAMYRSLEYSKRALEVAPDQVHFQFNVAFVQFQLAQLIFTLPENQKTLAEVEAAAEALEMAIESFSQIAKSSHPPYPRHDIEQRANMGKNTMRRQLERTVATQREYEEANKSKLAEARILREAELRRREEQRIAAENAARAEKERLAEERRKLLESSRSLAEKRAEEERKREEAEWTIDEDGEKVKRKRKAKAAGGGGKRRKKTEDGSGSEGSAAEGDGAANSQAAARRKARAKSAAGTDTGTGDGEEKPRKKKRRLAKRPGKAMKSAEVVEDSSEEDGDNGVRGTQVPTGSAEQGGPFDSKADEEGDVDMEDADDDADEEETAARGRRGQKKTMVSDDDEEEGEGEGGGEPASDPFAVDGDDDRMDDEPGPNTQEST